MGDHLRFEPARGADGGQGADQPGVDGRRVVFDTYCGVKKLPPVKVDLVVGSLMTTSPEELSSSVFDFDGVEPVRMKLYPVVDHIADKVCATQARYGSDGSQSSRVRDLVDLVVFARTQNLDGSALTIALEQEWAARRLEGSLAFKPPSSWATQYPSLARGVRACDGFTTFDSATALIVRLLEPVRNGKADGQRWERSTLQWTTVDDD
ncbi:nucleotidyl transferase AbiEii/AbiGii toxin family protein [Arthrobacter castelli]|uniref:nucleotidyl transferase AbiEii/AbiGii toxin family protein n=1 Tax=Arthrobacter castelli TaxID=271431 RepID=UPI001FE11916|nr:nucleotidyl transferase AbiEii/AbiGii toxin family protein [Arthrobacter castelli]